MARKAVAVVSTDDATLPASAAGGTRGRILAAGLELFADRGYHATSIRDIARVAGLQSASLYSYFATKEAILAELVMLGHDEHHRRLLSAVLQAGTDPRGQLRAIVNTHVRAHCEYPMLGVVTNNELHNLSPEAASPALALRHHSEQLLAEVLDRGAREGVFDMSDVEATGYAIATMGTSVAVWWPLRQGTRTAEELAEAYTVLALRMVGAS